MSKCKCKGDCQLAESGDYCAAKLIEMQQQVNLAGRLMEAGYPDTTILSRLQKAIDKMIKKKSCNNKPKA